MKKVGRHVTIDYDVDMWLRTTDFNVSDMCNNVLRTMMEAKNRAPIDERELQGEIEHHERTMQKHREELLVKRAELARIQVERDEAKKESLTQSRAMVDAIRAAGLNR
ncbi:MAG: hypothetical protein LC650_02500 [Actinobacteria bacterium]|nr:hypothetical protein [Actinomycetota bacterium]